MRIKLTLLLFVLSLLGCSGSGVRVVVSNVGSETMRETIVIVTGATYSLGTIASGNSVETIVNPIGESRIEIQFVDLDGTQTTVRVECYFEGGYKGHILVTLDNGTVTHVDDQIEI